MFLDSFWSWVFMSFCVWFLIFLFWYDVGVVVFIFLVKFIEWEIGFFVRGIFIFVVWGNDLGWLFFKGFGRIFVFFGFILVCKGLDWCEMVILFFCILFL